jgi:protein involved in polysaccharide export with SLBB domain
MQTTPVRRALALFLCMQPVLWMSNVALAQALIPPRAPQGGGMDEFGMPSSSASAGGEAVPSTLGMDPFAASNNRNAAAAAVPLANAPPIDEPLDPDKYILGPGDLMELNFWGVQNFRVRLKIDMEGRAFVPKVGYFQLQGKTLTEARKTMRESVARLFPRLNFGLSVAEPRTFLVQVVNAVVHPGSYSARAVDRVASLISHGGGFLPDSSKRRIEIRRRDGTVVAADLLLYDLTGDVKYNPYLLDGDVVRVPYQELSASIGGGVNRPGRYELIASRDLAELVELAGGLAPGATHLLPINVVRRTANDRDKLESIPFTPDGKLPALPIQNADSVSIPRTVELQQSVMVVGALNTATPPAPSPTHGPLAGADEASSTRRLAFVEGDTVRSLLERVGGVGPLADLRGSYILRSGNAVPVDLYTLLMLRDEKADRPIELGDTLVVPLRRRSILIQGAVFAPGAYPYNPTYGVDQYLALAGGPNRFAQSISNVRVISPNGETREYASDLTVEPGSSLVVPDRNFSRPEVVQIIISVASVLVTGVAVVLAARK